MEHRVIAFALLSKRDPVPRKQTELDKYHQEERKCLSFPRHIQLNILTPINRINKKIYVLLKCDFDRHIRLIIYETDQIISI